MRVLALALLTFTLSPAPPSHAEPAVSSAAAAASTAARTRIAPDTAVVILFEADAKQPSSAAATAAAAKCAQREGQGSEELIGCLIDARYVSDAKAARVARELYAKTGSVAGLLPEQGFDGAYRGKLHLVPHLPVAAERKHLEWLSGALVDIDAFFLDLQQQVPFPGRVAFRWTDLDIRFFRSVKRRTPSAFAIDWQVAYNVSGSLFTSTTRVRETWFHEIFHLNDADHAAAGSVMWSDRALSAIYNRIVAKCGKRIDCLKPYAPDSIIVKQKGGTYYAFMPDNGVREYAADLAKRYYVEQRALSKKEKLPAAKPFKCLAPENAEAMKILVDEFFGGVDRTPECT